MYMYIYKHTHIHTILAEMEEETVKVVSISELLQLSRPLTGASSLTTGRSMSSSFELRPSDEPLKPSGPVDPNLHNRNPNPRFLKSLNQPTILTGTLTLPTHDNPSASDTALRCSRTNCFLFSDGSSTICCDILELDLRILGKKIHVLAWNFIPFGCPSGFLEIIRWSFPETSAGLSQCSSKPEAFPLFSGSSIDCKESSKARYRILGAIESVSPVSVVPCTMGVSSSRSNSGQNSSGPGNLRGFLARIMVCDCKVCSSKDLAMDLNDMLQGKNHHFFRQPVFVYFSGYASSWYPVISKLIGNVVSLLGLKKKLVYIGKEDSQLMYVSTEKASLQILELQNRWTPATKTVIKGKGECGAYIGTVTGIYMQGMVVELDQDVWLIVTDQLLTPPLSLRVGAIVSLRNVHFVNPNFSWTKVLILGACYKTSIIVESFSPMETVCCIYTQSQSLLGKFIDKLAFSARLWVLLLVACFKKKFNGILSEKEILGSKHKEGMVQTYARSNLPSSVFRSRQGVLAEYCKHHSSGCGSEPNYGHLKLVVPISNFVSHCETTWLRLLLEKKNGCDLICNGNQYSFLSCEGRSSDLPLRRFLQSEDVGVVLLGSLKISQSSGKLQLTDATGSIDVVIPDLSSTWSINSIYQVNDFTLVTEGKHEEVGHLGLLFKDSFSCRSIFNWVPLAREIKLAIYLHFYLRSRKSSNSLFYPSINWKGNFEELESGGYHLLWVTHKFPLLQKFQSEQVTLDKSGMFAEAIVLPWDLFLAGKDGDTRQIKASVDQLKNSMEHYADRDYEECVSSKRYKIDLTSGLSNSEKGSCDNPNCCSSVYNKSHGDWNCCNLSSLEIPCLVTVRSVHDYSQVSSGFLHCRKSNVKVGAGYKSNARKVLLEFTSDSFCKYQLLQIGGYYIIKHHKEDTMCPRSDSNYISGGNIVITGRTNLWSLSFYSDEVLSDTRLSRILSLNDSCVSNNEILSEGSHQIEVPLLRFDEDCPKTFSDIHIYLPTDAINVLEDGLVKPSFSLEEVGNISQCTGTLVTASVQSCRTSGSDYMLPEGTLISLHGYVVAVHNSDCSSLAANLSEISKDVPQDKSFQGVTSSVCILVLAGHRIVRVSGALSKHAYLIGFGPGANATFHRILVLRQNELMLTAASFIVINSIRVVNDHYTDNFCNPSVASGLDSPEFLDTVPSGLISEIIQQLESKPIQFHCRVVAVYILVLEKNKEVIYSQSGINLSSAVVNIPLAGFVLDDGSSLCCCWANSERAATLLRLHEDTQHKAPGRSFGRSKQMGKHNACSPTVHRVDKMLRRHGRVIAKNYGFLFDSSCQDLTLSVGLDNVLSSWDEDLLKFIFLNACLGTFWTVVGTLMDSTAIEQLEKRCMEMDMVMPQMQNIWAREVYHTNPLGRARNIIQELQNM
ncbi:CST complex subunit CTC1 isoform X2 [Cornus florida]|uniref:CST complex subunit CTC1 isoform X2 n=1 Tax=Cornus florida TaxID=4283 RepID=UPI00289ED527|nr:CST complex subunit CTC1 isoform X2 [Cornus florida]